MGAIGKRKGFKVEAVEENKEWYGIVNRYLSKLGYDHVNLVYAPIVNNWYDYQPQEDFVFCDGPSRSEKGSRENIANISKYFTKAIIIDDYNNMELPEFTFHKYDNYAIGIK